MSIVALSKGPAVHLLGNKNKHQGENLPVRSVSQTRQIEEDARSVHTDRHYDKSARSGKSQDKSVKSHESRNPSEHSRKSDQRSEKRSRHENGSVSSRSSYSEHFRKVSSSLVSNPDNLICDDCINKNIGKHQKDKLDALKDADKEHALRTNANLKKQLEDEKEKHLEKLRMYRDGIEGQNQDLLARKDKKKLEEDAEKQRILKQLADKSDLIATEQKLLDRRDKFREELADQLARNKEAENQKNQDKLDLEKRTHNLLIDDAWRDPHKKALKNHYKENLINQLEEKEKDKFNAKQALKDADAQYIDEVKAYNQKDKEARDAIEAEKKDLLRSELEKQLRENQDKKKANNDLKNIEDQRHKDKVAHDNGIFRDNMERKKAQLQDYLKDLTGQAQDKELAKTQAHLDSKKPEGTGLHIPQKVKKCYGCAVCKRILALERLNKRYEVHRHLHKKNHTHK